jgi:hypothetical protein
MPVKYQPEDSVREVREARRTPFQSMDRGPGGLRRRQQWIILIVPAVLIFMMFLAGRYQAAREEAPFEDQPLLRGSGLILNKRIDNAAPEPRYLLEIYCQIIPENREEPLEFTDIAETDREAWEKFARNDRIGVLYQISRNGGAVRIRECGRLALPQ